MEKLKSRALIKFNETNRFERINAKYNRLWQQITDLGILEIQVIAGYFFAVLAYNGNDLQDYTLLQVITFILILILMGITASIGILYFEKDNLFGDLEDYCS